MEEKLQMDEKLLVETVVLAGKIMLSSGAEVYRVEETMNYMLKKSSYQTAEPVVFATGLFVSLDDPDKDLITVARRIAGRGTNVNRVTLVNDISRRFCDGRITTKEAYDELKKVECSMQYPNWMKPLGIIGISASFTAIFGGTPYDFIPTALCGAVLAVTDWFEKKIRLNDFCINALGAFMVAFFAHVIERFLIPGCDTDVMIISPIMTLVPGVCFTTACRDILNGDYGAGSARMLEAIVTALAVAAGVGSGLVAFDTIFGGGM